jgi:hypothetical protein
VTDLQTISTGCTCSLPPDDTGWFWCDPHQCKKNGDMQRMCATDPASFTAWSEGRGPNQGSIRRAVSTHPPVIAPLHPATTMGRIRHFFQALIKHAKDWFRKCSQKEIRQRLAICEQCEHFSGTACVQCGCPVNLEKRFRNKLAWRSESCPLGKWPVLAKVQRNPSIRPQNTSRKP